MYLHRFCLATSAVNVVIVVAATAAAVLIVAVVAALTIYAHNAHTGRTFKNIKRMKGARLLVILPFPPNFIICQSVTFSSLFDEMLRFPRYRTMYWCAEQKSVVVICIHGGKH